MKHEIIRPVLSVWLRISACVHVCVFPLTLVPLVASLGNNPGRRDPHHHRLHSGGLHHAGLWRSLLHRGKSEHSGPARLPSQQQLHGLSERCEYSLTPPRSQQRTRNTIPRSLDSTSSFCKRSMCCSLKIHIDYPARGYLKEKHSPERLGCAENMHL